MTRLGLVVILAVRCFAQAEANRAVIEATPPRVLWREPKPATIEDWKCGFEGCDYAPAPPFQFVKEDVEGTTAKLDLKDAKGRSWAVKFGAKAITEPFGYRFVTAVGYFAEPSYYVKDGVIQGAPRLRRASRYVKPDGSFRNARFQIRDKKFDFVKNSAWSIAENPFRGTYELAGLKILLMLLSNWDVKDNRDLAEGPNTAIFNVSGSQFYSFFDWGSTLGRWGGLMRRDRSDCSGFALDTPKFAKSSGNGAIEWGFEGKHGEDVTSGITVEDVRWLLPYLRRITQEQLQAGLTASGATARQTACWSDSIQARIRQLEAVAR
jgi:hypothetical protein